MRNENNKENFTCDSYRFNDNCSKWWYIHYLWSFTMIDSILLISSIPLGLYVLFRFCKKYPKLSRELHKKRCRCNVCFPITEYPGGNLK